MIHKVKQPSPAENTSLFVALFNGYMQPYPEIKVSELIRLLKNIDVEHVNQKYRDGAKRSIRKLKKLNPDDYIRIDWKWVKVVINNVDVNIHFLQDNPKAYKIIREGREKHAEKLKK